MIFLGDVTKSVFSVANYWGAIELNFAPCSVASGLREERRIRKIAKFAILNLKLFGGEMYVLIYAERSLRGRQIIHGGSGRVTLSDLLHLGFLREMAGYVAYAIGILID